MKPRIVYDQLTYRALSDERILERFHAKIEQRYRQSLPDEDKPEDDETTDEIYLGPEVVRDILSEVYRDLKNEAR